MMVDAAVARATPSAAFGTPAAAAEDAGAAGLGFAALLAGEPPAAPAEAATPVPEVAVEAETDTAADASADEEDAPPLLGWLFGVMAAKEAPAQATATEPAEAVRTAGWVERSASQRAVDGAVRAAAPIEAAIDAPAIDVPQTETAALLETAPEAPVPDLPEPPAMLPRPDPSGPAQGLAIAEVRVAPQSAVAAAAAAAHADTALIATSPDFAVDLGERITWQLDEGVSEAQIELHPAELGRLVVRIETRGDEAQVRILAAEPATRALLAQALPQLRELFGSAGLSLTRAQIGDAGSRRDERGAERSALQEPLAGQRRRVARILLVDAYA